MLFLKILKKSFILSLIFSKRVLMAIDLRYASLKGLYKAYILRLILKIRRELGVKESKAAFSQIGNQVSNLTLNSALNKAANRALN